MKIQPVNHEYDPIVPYRNEFYQSLAGKYTIDVKKGLNSLGTRNLCYYQKANTLIISNAFTGRVHVINLTTGDLRHYDHHDSTVRDIKVVNNEILTTGWDGTTRIVSFSTLKQRLALTDTYMGRSPYLTVSHDGKYVYSYSYDTDKNPLIVSNKIRRWQVDDGRFINDYYPLGNLRSGTRSGACVIYQRNLYSISNSGNLNVFHLDTGKLLQENIIHNDLRSMCLVPAFHTILIGDVEGFVHFYDLKKHCLTKSVHCHPNEITFIKVHPEHPDMVFSCCFDGVVKIHNFPSFSQVNSITTGNFYAWVFRFIADRILVCGEGGDICVYQIKDFTNIILAGKIRIFPDAYIVLLNDTLSSVYSSDRRLLTVRDKDNQKEVDPKLAESLLLTLNNASVLVKLFGQGNKPLQFPSWSGPISLLPIRN